MSKRYERVIKKKKKSKEYETDYGINLTNEEKYNLVVNLICPNCGWITSFINTLCKVKNIVIATRICECCDKVYELNFNTKFDTLEEAEKFWKDIKSYTSRRAYLCKIGKNIIISNYGKTCSTEDCKKHTQTIQKENKGGSL